MINRRRLVGINFPLRNGSALARCGVPRISGWLIRTEFKKGATQINLLCISCFVKKK